MTTNSPITASQIMAIMCIQHESEKHFHFCAKVNYPYKQPSGSHTHTHTHTQAASQPGRDRPSVTHQTDALPSSSSSLLPSVLLCSPLLSSPQSLFSLLSSFLLSSL